MLALAVHTTTGGCLPAAKVISDRYAISIIGTVNKANNGRAAATKRRKP
jgi:hypothetical protein